VTGSLRKAVVSFRFSVLGLFSEESWGILAYLESIAVAAPAQNSKMREGLGHPSTGAPAISAVFLVRCWGDGEFNKMQLSVSGSRFSVCFREGWASWRNPGLENRERWGAQAYIQRSESPRSPEESLHLGTRAAVEGSSRVRQSAAD